MSVKSVYSVELQQHVRYVEATVGDLKDGDTFVLFQSDLGGDYRITAQHRDSSGALWYTSTLNGGEQPTKSILKPEDFCYIIF
jgi:hypothetical protein